MNRAAYQATALCIFLLIGSCYSSSTDLLDETGTIGSGGGIGGSGVASYSVGTLTGIGSVFINGNRFDTTTADFLVNGQTAELSQLRVGMQLLAEVDFNSSAAGQVDYTAVLIGPLDSAPDIAGQFRVLGQSVIISANTVFDVLTLTDLVAGLSIEISGVTDASGNLIASYIRPARNSELQIAGTVSAVDANLRHIKVRNISIMLEQADLGPLNGVPLARGASVIVAASANQYDASNNSLLASSVAAGSTISPTENARIELTGLVQSFNDVTSFSVDGIQITATEVTQFETVHGLPLNANAVSLNSLIEVEGKFLSSGIIDAQRIVVLPVENTELVGRLEAIDSEAKTVTLFGALVRTTSVTRYSGDDHDSDNGNGSMNFDTLRVGDYAEIDASLTSAGLIATKIEIDEFDDEASLEGPVTRLDVNQRQIEIVGVSITFNDNTDFEMAFFKTDGDDSEQEVDEQSFLGAVSVGTIVKAKWKVFSSVMEPVDELGIE